MSHKYPNQASIKGNIAVPGNISTTKLSYTGNGHEGGYQISLLTAPIICHSWEYTN